MTIRHSPAFQIPGPRVILLAPDLGPLLLTSTASYQLKAKGTVTYFVGPKLDSGFALHQRGTDLHDHRLHRVGAAPTL